ncbi:FAD-dependent oxidoreductase [Nonomuraea ferruginea]|uniref:FAD-binding protein n=1 Tax=Nonomuraea ferruginea TaxID=46174 RepID=A0ABT4T8H3_9ACTN|nr:FAD-binding protein [Nonomuraea ferruginea]MDA0645811.1 FAD-binding protein [Nonomuraea ferruginea]
MSAGNGGANGAGNAGANGAENAEDLGRYDVIVIGAGGAGMCTAIEAAAAGASVLVLEKQNRIGGMLHIANGEFSGAGTRRQRERGIDDSPERHFEDVLRLSHGKVDEKLAWKSVKAQGETVDWLDGQGFDFHPDTPGLVHGHEVYSVPRTYWGVKSGLSVVKPLKRRLEEQIEAGRVRLLLNTRLTGAIVDAAGHVTGITATTAGGATTATTAPGAPGAPAATAVGGAGGELVAHGGAVVLATGGYDANPGLRNRFLPDGCESALIGCLPHATGDGLELAMGLGAQVSRDGYFIPVMGLIPDPGQEGFAVDYREAFIEVAPAYRTPYEIWVNDRGERFVAEDGTSPEHRERALLEQPRIAMHVVWDRAIAETAEPLIRNGAGDWTRERMLAELERGRWIAVADTLEELAAKLGVAPGGLAATVERYNAAVRAGRDDDFGRTTLPAPIERAPFYGITTVGASILSRDGLRVNEDLEVLTESGAPLPGLYAVGEILGNNVFAGDNYVGGMSVTPAMTLGRELGARLGAGR